MFGLNEVPDLSSGGGARESCVIREPISIFSQIKNVKDEKKKEKLTQLLETLKKNLPEGFKIGAAVSARDCFFDSVTQGLNELKGKGLITSDEGFNVQSLRRGCKEYAQRELNTSQNSWLNKLLDKESEKLPEYIPRIEFTAEDIKNTSSGSAVGILNLQNAIWGRPYIEGQILCNEYKVNLCYMEVQDDLIIENGKFYLRLEEDSKAKRGEEISDIILKNVIEADNGNTEQRTIHIVNYKQHFVPLLSDLKEDIEEAIKVSRKEIYGIPDNKNSHSLTEDTGSYDLEKMKNSKEAYGKKQEKDSNSKDKASEQMKSLKTVGDGNCFFHAVFGNNSSIGYKAEKAQEMRMEWHKFLSQFKSLSDPSMTEPLKESLKLVFSYLLSNVSEIHNVSPKMGDYIKETNRVIDKRIDESKEKVETLKNNIIEVFCKDEELRKQMYEKITQSIEARNERNKNSPQKQKVLLSIEDLREEKNRKELCDRIGDVTFPCASICGYVSTQAEYQDQYITNNDDILNSLFDNQEFYRLYLENIKSQDYFVFHNEIGILASLSGTEIEVYSDGQINPVIYTPDSGMINSNYVREYVLWGNKKREKIYHSGMHFSRTEVIPEQKESHSPDSSCGKQGSSINRSSSRDEMQKQSLRLEERTSTKSQNKGSSVSAKSSLDQSSKEFIQSTEEDNLQVWLENTVIDDIAKYLYEWTEDNNVIWGVEGPGRLPRELNKFKKNKGKTLIYIINKDGNHWVTLVAINKNGQGDIFFYADSFGEGIEKCLVTGFGKGDIDSNTQNKVSQGEVDCNGQNVKQNSDNDVIFVEETVPLINDNIRIPLDEFLEREGFSKNNIHSVSCKQQNDTYNCGVFALENAKAILNAVKDGNDDPTKVKESLKAVNKDIKYLNSLRENFASSLKKVSSINKQSSVTFSSSSEKGIEESIEQEPLHNYEELEEQTLRKLKEISSKYILTDKQKENELSAFIKMQDKDRGKFDKLWEGFVSLSPDEKKKAILRIFFFAEFWDSSVDTNENALRNVVWKEVGKLNAEDYIFRKSVDYLISFASTPSPSEPLISTGKRLHSNGLRRVLSRAQSFLSKDEMGNLIIRICIEIFKMRNTFNIGELFTSNKVKERLSTLKNFCESGRKDKIADLTLCDYQDYKILCPLLKERSQPSVKFIIDYLIKNLEWEESTLKDPLEDFIGDLYEEEHPRKDYSSNQKKEFLKQYNYYLIALAIDQVIQYNESPLEKVLSIAKDHFSEEEMNAMLERACKYIVDQRNKSVEGVAFDSEKAFRLLSDKLNSINRKKEEILKFLVDKLGKIQDFSENCQSSTLQQTLEEVVSYSPSRGKNTGNRNHESCSKNFFDELTMILDGGKTDKQDKIQSFISSRLSRYKGNCFYSLLLGEFLFENQDHAQISQKYLLLHLDSESIAFLLTAGQREKAKTTVLSIIDKSRGPVPNISSFAIDYRNLQIVNLEIDSRKSHLLDDIKKEDIEQGYKIKFIPMNEEVISLDLLRKAIKDVGSRQQVIYNLNNIINQVNYIVNLDNDKIKFSFIRNEKDCETLVNSLLMGSEHKISFDSEIINEIISSLVKNNIQAKSNNIRDHRLPIADKRSGKKDKKKAEYYAYLSREYGIFSSQADVRGDRAIFNRSGIHENRKRPIINEENYGCNGLHLAIANEKFDDVKKLVEANDGYVKGRDFYGNTPLHFAVQGKNLEILQFLMDYIGKQNHKEDYFVDENHDGCTPLHFAAGSGNVEFFSKLLKFVGAEAKEGYVKIENNKGETPLHFAARSGKAEVVSKLLEFVDAKEGYVQSKDNKGETPLHFAARSGNVKVVEKLLEYVNDKKEGYVKHENSNKCTPLHFAAWGSNVEVINKLLEFVGAEAKEGYVQSKNNKGETPLHFAAKKNNVGVILSLIGCVTGREGKENYVKCTNKLLYTPLHFAARSGNVEVINKLLEFVGAEAKEGYVQSKNNKGEAPLHFAARGGNVKAVERLLEYVNDEEGYVRAENNEKETSLHFAARSGNVEVINKLLEFVGAEAKEGYVQSKNNKGEAPLHFAARGGNVKAVERLLQCVGKDEKENYIGFVNNDNENALDIAISCGSWKVFDELLKYIKNLEQSQHYLDLAKQASGSKKRNVYSLDDLQTKGRVEGRKKQRNKELITKETHSHSEAVKDDNNPCSQSESPTSPYSKKRSRISDGNTQKPSEKKVALDDSLRQNVDVEESVGSHQKEDEFYKQDSSSLGSQEGEQPTLNDVESNGENQEAFSRSSSTSDKSDNNNLSEESESWSSVDVRDNIDDDNISKSKQDSASNKSNMFESCISLISDVNASENQLLEKVKHFVKMEGDINLTSKDNMTLLHLACKNSRWEVAKYLIGNKKVRLDLADNDDKTPLHHAVYYIRFYLYHYLLEEEKKEVIRQILEGIKKNFSQNQQQMYNCINAKDSKGKTPLMYIVEVSKVNVAKILLEYQADIKTQDHCGNTALHIAASSSNVAILDKLLEFVDEEKKEDYLEIKNNKGETPLHFAARSGNVEVINKLLEFVGAEAKEGYVQSKNNKGETPLHFTARSGNVKAVERLLQCVGKDEKENYIECKNNGGKNALEIAISFGNQEVFFELLKYIKNSERKQYYKELIAKKTHSNSGTVRDGNNPCSQSESPTSPYSKKRSRISDGKTQKPPVKKVAQSDSPRQEVKIKSSVGNDESDEQQDSSRERGPEISSSRSSSPDSQKVEHTASNDISERSSGDEESVYSSPEQNSGSSLEQASNSSERNDLQSISLQGDNHDNDEVAVALKDLEHGSAGKRSDIDGGDIPPKNSDLVDCLLSDTLSDEYVNFISSMQGSCGIGNASPQSVDLNSLPSISSFFDLFKSRSSSNNSDNSAEQESANVGNDESYEQQDSDRESDLEANNSRSDSMDSQKDEEGSTRLHIAAAEGNNEFVKTLLKKGDDVNSKNKHGRTPLHDAVVNGNNEVVKTLLERGASIDSKDKDDCTPLRLALADNKWEIVRILLEKVANDSNMLPIFNALNIEIQSPKTTLNSVTLDNQLRRRSASF